MEKDTGSWLSAQQAILADGTEVKNLPLVNKTLPPLVRAGAILNSPDQDGVSATSGRALEAIKFAVGTERGIEFLKAWLQGRVDVIRKNWPDASQSIF